MNRITIFEKNGELMLQHERLSKQPSGNALQRQKQIRHGWKPEWTKSGQPEKLYSVYSDGKLYSGYSDGIVIPPNVRIIPSGRLPVPEEIEAALAIAASYQISDLKQYDPDDEPLFASPMSKGLYELKGLLNDPEIAEIARAEIKFREDKLIAHTCIDQPTLRCANPFCAHVPKC